MAQELITKARDEERKARKALDGAERWLRLSSACRRLDVHPRTLYRWIEAGRFGKDARQLPGGHWRIKESAVVGMLRADL